MLTTRQKIALARLCERPLVGMRRTLGLGSDVRTRRGGVVWQLDLQEGIDFAIYLLGAFERNVARAYGRLVKPGAVVLDIGANVGAHTLPLARLVGPNGRVLALEPTDWAFSKLQANVALNPELSRRVRLVQTFLLAAENDRKPEAVCSSWPLDATVGVHPQLRGREMSAAASRAETLDAVLQSEGIDHVDFVKVDVDGHEGQVLRGGARMLRQMRPTMLIELGPSLLIEQHDSIDAVLDLLRDAGYSLFHLGGAPVDFASAARIAERRGAENFVARPSPSAVHS